MILHIFGQRSSCYYDYVIRLWDRLVNILLRTSDGLDMFDKGVNVKK